VRKAPRGDVVERLLLLGEEVPALGLEKRGREPRALLEERRRQAAEGLGGVDEEGALGERLLPALETR
jgi:hypothetical protein